MKTLIALALMASLIGCSAEGPNSVPSAPATYTVCDTPNCGDNINIIVE